MAALYVTVSFTIRQQDIILTAQKTAHWICVIVTDKGTDRHTDTVKHLPDICPYPWRRLLKCD